MVQFFSKSEGHPRMKSGGLFAIGVMLLYAILFALCPEKTLLALKASIKVAVSLGAPLLLVSVVLFLANCFIRPAQVGTLLGSHVGVRGILFALFAGILSAGPIFAWYPLLKELKQQGAGEATIAVFLYNRAVKPFLLPVMVTYYGWHYVVVLTVLMLLGSIVLGYIVQLLALSRRNA